MSDKVKKRVKFASYDDAHSAFRKQYAKQAIKLAWFIQPFDIDCNYGLIELRVGDKGSGRWFHGVSKKRCIEKAFEYYGWEV